MLNIISHSMLSPKVQLSYLSGNPELDESMKELVPRDGFITPHGPVR
jgi:hypothetical protein